MIMAYKENYAATKNHDCERKMQQFTSFLTLNFTIWFSWTLDTVKQKNLL